MERLKENAYIPLNERGKQQAHETKLNLKNINFDIIICSPLIRAKQTAEIINSDRNLTIIFDDRLRERNYGEFEGTSKSSK